VNASSDGHNCSVTLDDMLGKQAGTGSLGMLIS
jgi:hypothetical protein